MTRGGLASAGGAVGPAWFTAAWAAAKLGAGLAGLPARPRRSVPCAVPVDGGILNTSPPTGPGGGEREASRRRLSGTSTPPDSVIFSLGGRAVRRSFTPARIATIGPVLAELVARLRAAPGTTLVAVGPVADALVTFHANVVLVGGGRVVSASAANEALALGAEHDAGAAVLAPGALAGLAALGGPARDALDLTRTQTLVVGGAPLTTQARATAADLFGPGVLVDVYATADTGVIAVRAGGEEHHTLLGGVEARLRAGGRLEVRSPLAATPGWLATGDRATLGAGGELTLAAGR